MSNKAKEELDISNFKNQFQKILKVVRKNSLLVTPDMIEKIKSSAIENFTPEFGEDNAKLLADLQIKLITNPIETIAAITAIISMT